MPFLQNVKAEYTLLLYLLDGTYNILKHPNQRGFRLMISSHTQQPVILCKIYFRARTKVGTLSLKCYPHGYRNIALFECCVAHIERQRYKYAALCRFFGKRINTHPMGIAVTVHLFFVPIHIVNR